MTTTLSFYDFDRTLMNSPLPDSGKKIWKEKTGQEYPHVGWWSKPDSLNTDIFEIKPNLTILNQFREDTTKSDTKTILITSRLKKLEPQIIKILKLNNINFDELSFKNDDKDKGERIKEFLIKYPNVNTLNIYDDREKEISVFERLKKELEGLYQVNIYRVTNGNYALVEGINVIEKLIFEEIEKFYK